MTGVDGAEAVFASGSGLAAAAATGSGDGGSAGGGGSTLSAAVTMPRSRTATVTFDATGRIGSTSRLGVATGSRGPGAGAVAGVGSGARASFGVGAGIGRAGAATAARSGVAGVGAAVGRTGSDLRRLHIRHGHVGRYWRRLARARSPGDDAAILGDRHQGARRREEHRQPRRSTGAGCLGIRGQRGQVNRQQRRSLGSGDRDVVGRHVPQPALLRGSRVAAQRPAGRARPARVRVPVPSARPAGEHEARRRELDSRRTWA